MAADVKKSTPDIDPINNEENTGGKNVPGDRIVRTSHEGRRDFDEGGFWDFDKPKKKVYKKPEFAPGSLDSASVERVNTVSAAAHEGEVIPKKSGAGKPDEKKSSAKMSGGGAVNLLEEMGVFITSPGDDADEKAGGSGEDEKDSFDEIETEVVRDSGSKSGGGRVVRTVDGERAVPAYSYGTYSRKKVGKVQKKTGEKQDSVVQKREAQPDVVYSPGGAFINKITVKEWVSDTDFYSRFAEDVEKSQKRVSRYPYTVDLPEVKFFSYVPQYSHMTRSQIEFYDWVKDCVNHGKYPMCDLSYLQLYVYELINLPGDERAVERAELMTSLLIAYKDRFMNKYPLFVGNLCEWLADYCMIHRLNAPSRLIPYLPEIVAKSQIKEFYLDGIFHEYAGDEEKLYRNLAEAFIYSMSDYDYRVSRYYADNREAYDSLIPGVVAAVLKSQLEDRRGIFGFGRVYRIVRDTYVGAVASIRTKKRMELELYSCIRLESTRDIMTKVIKYAENKVRQIYSLKSKLAAKLVDVRDIDVIDGYFAPMMAKAGVKQKKSAEDRYMPDGYMKNYEAETSGFDLSAAEAIERESWVNTTRLMSAEDGDVKAGVVDSAKDDAPAAVVESVNVEEVQNPVGVESSEPLSESKADDVIVGAVKAALDGRFVRYARECGVYEGELTDRVNNVFLDEIGDILIDGGVLIEDYRDDAMAWLEKNE